MLDPLSLVYNPLVRELVLAAWLVPCAIQDYRTRHVSNWLTIPAFLLAFPLSYLVGGWAALGFTGVVFLVTFLALPLGFNAADGKMAVCIAALGGGAPLLVSFGLLLGIFYLLRSYPLPRLIQLAGGYTDEVGRLHLVGAPWFLIGSVLTMIGGI